MRKLPCIYYCVVFVDMIKYRMALKGNRMNNTKKRGSVCCCCWDVGRRRGKFSPCNLLFTPKTDVNFLISFFFIFLFCRQVIVCLLTVKAFIVDDHDLSVDTKGSHCIKKVCCKLIVLSLNLFRNLSDLFCDLYVSFCGHKEGELEKEPLIKQNPFSTN